jgi:hypothetical protein
VKLKGIDEDIEILNRAIVELIEMGRWDLRVEQSSWCYKEPEESCDSFDIKVFPKVVSNVKTFPANRFGKLQFYDSRIAEIECDEEKYCSPKLKPDSGFTEKIVADENGDLYRGMSWEEFQSVKKTGVIQSKGGYNIGETQIGFTYFSEDPETAAHYGGTFQPYHMMPTFDRPGYVVKIKRPPEDKLNLDMAPQEIGVKGPIPVSEIIEVHEIRPYYITPGDVEIRRVWGQGTPATFVEGSRSSPGVWVGYKKILQGEW